MSDSENPRASGPDRPGPPDLRASDDERERVLRLLSTHASAGRLTLAEHEERMSHALEAKTRGDLDRLLADLPAVRGTTGTPTRRKVSRWILSVMGGTDRTGRWRVGETVNVLTIMGGTDLDLRNAELDSDNVTLNLFTLMGGVDVYVPDTVDLEVTGFSLMGGRGEHGTARRPREGAPRVTIRAFNLMGGSDIYRLPEETRGLSGARAARELKRWRRGHGSPGHPRQLDS